MRFLWVIGLMGVFTSCVSDHTEEAYTDRDSVGSRLTPINIVVVLDLSNRLIRTPGQAEKDQEIITSVLDLFETRQKRQAYITSKDLLRIVVAPQPDVPTSTNDKLRIDMDLSKKKKQGGVIGRPKFVQDRAIFEQEVAHIYSQALKQPFTGADLYTFFCTELPANFVSGEMATKVIVLTDGYLEFDRPYLSKRPACTYMRELDKMRAEKEKWKSRFERKKLALCPCPDADLNGIDVLLLETAPLFKGESVYEVPMIQHYWNTWLESMGVSARIEPHENQVAGIKDKIKAFLEE